MKLRIILMASMLLLAGSACISLSDTIILPQFPQGTSIQDWVLLENITYSFPHYPVMYPYYNFNVTLNKDDIVYLSPPSPTAWGEFAMTSVTDDYPPLEGLNGPIFIWADFNYTADNGEGKTTKFELVYYFDMDQSRLITAPSYPLTGPPIHLYPNISETLLVDNPNDCKLFGGVVNFTGKYTIWLYGPFELDLDKIGSALQDDPNMSFPITWELYKYKEQYAEHEPYKSLFPVGISLLILGGGTMILGTITIILEKRNRKSRRFSKPGFTKISL